MFNANDHTFVILAYGESEFLEDCIASLCNQCIKSKIIMATSTPNSKIEELSKKYKIPLYMNSDKKGIASDWNYAYKIGKTKLVTLAHQDDIYETDYLKEVIRCASCAKKPMIIFTNYGEIREGKKIGKNQLLLIKRIMLYPLKFKKMQKSRWIRRRILSIGSAISCPTVTYVKENLPKTIFQEGYKSDLDWQAWENLSRREGEFIYCSKLCMYHRIHKGSETTRIIAEDGRSREDFEMLCKFWPKSIAKIIAKFYILGQNSNKLKS